MVTETLRGIQNRLRARLYLRGALGGGGNKGTPPPAEGAEMLPPEEPNKSVVTFVFGVFALPSLCGMDIEKVCPGLSV